MRRNMTINGAPRISPLMDATVLSTNSMEIAFTRVTRGMIKKVKRITINTVDIFIL